MPSVKLVEKKLVVGKVIDHYDSPKTPYQRILESPDVAASLKRDLKEQLETLNPFRSSKIAFGEASGDFTQTPTSMRKLSRKDSPSYTY